MRNKRSKQTKVGMKRAVERGAKIGAPLKVSDAAIREVMDLDNTEGARRVGLCRSQFIVRRRRLEDQI